MIEIAIDSSDIIKTLKKYKVLLIAIILICTLMAIAYSIWGTKYYDSTSIFRTLELENVFIPNINSEIKNYKYLATEVNNPERVNMYSFNLLKTNNFSLKTISKFNLKEYFEITEIDSLKIRDEALKKYKEELTNFIYDEESELVTIHVMSKYPRLSFDIVNYQYELLNDYYKNEYYKHKDVLIVFLESRIEEVTKKKEEIDAQIMSYDEKNMSFELNTKLEVLLQNYFKIYQEKITTGINLQIAYTNYGSASNITRELAQKDSLLSTQLALFTTNTNNDPAFLSFQDVPKHILTQSKLLHEQELYTDLISYLRLIHESAKIDRLRYQEVLDIIDYPNLPGLHSKPKPVLTITLTLILTSLLSTILIYNYDLYKRNNQH